MSERTRRAWAGIGAAAAAITLATSLASVAPAGASSSPALMQQAQKALLRLSDMPAGWTKTKSSTPNSNVGDAQLAHCIGVPTSIIAENPPSASSPQFEDKSGLTINDQVTVFPSTANAAAEFASVANPKTPGCMTQLASGPLKAKLFGKTPAGVSYGTVLVSPTNRSTFPGTAGYSLSVPVSEHGQTVNVTTTELFAVKGRLGQQITFTSAGESFSIGLEQHLASVAVGRL